MTFKLAQLPYATNALEPFMSQRTLEFHYGKHHGGYVQKLNELIEGKQYAKLTLEEIVRKTAAKPDDRAIFNNAAQSWNHAFFWNSMQPGGGGEPEGKVAEKLSAAFGSYSEFRQTFIDTALAQFGSGWVWLVQDRGKLAVIGTAGAETPLNSERLPLLTCDVWEHAYYLDYQNRRKAFVESYLDHLVNWERVAARLKEAGTEEDAPRVESAGRRQSAGRA